MAIEVPNWSALRSVGESLPAKLTVLFPIVSNLIIFNDFVADSYAGNQTLFKFIPNLSDKFDFYLLCTFVGLVIFACGQIFYVIFCPALIKKYCDVDDFLISRKDSISKGLLLLWAKEAENSTCLTDSEKSEEGISSAISVLQNEKFTLPEMNDQVVNISRLYYSSKERLHIYSRIFVIICFSAGLLLMFMPSLLTTISAADQILK